MDVAAPQGSEAAIQQIRAVLSAAVAGAGAADGLPSKQHAHVSMPLVSSEAQASYFVLPRVVPDVFMRSRLAQ